MGKTYDFSGWATRNDLKCSDGRTIRKDAFKDNDGSIVPLVWNHQHDESFNVLGHALLENREEGVYAYCTFNDTESGQNAKLLVQHGDISSLSIYANRLKQNGGDVLHGAIREVSLVLAGANPGAYIDSIMAHGDATEEEAIIYTGENLSLFHAEESEEEELEEEKKEEVVEEPEDKKEEDPEPEDKKEEEPEDPADDSENLEHADSKEKEMADNEKTVADVFNEMSEEQKNVVYFMIGQALEDAGVSGEGEEMNHNVFENDNTQTDVLSHADMEEIFADAKRYGSLADAVNRKLDGGVLEHADGDTPEPYGITDIEFLFPEARNLNVPPQFIMRNQQWVGIVMNGVHHTPFSRIKSTFANITEDEARAKGYIKGNKKKNEVFSLLKRTTTPQTVYKKQKLDRDDIVDITDFDVVAWLKKEMRMMLDEELARAFLIGDGRESSAEDHISPEHIRPVWTDDDLFTIKELATVDENATYDEKCNAVIDAVILGNEDYEGSGNKVMFCDKWFITRAMLMRNGIGERLYKNINELASEMDVNRIVPVPVFKNQSRVDGGVTKKLVAIVLDLNDYNVGADKGGEVNMFDDFDIDFNQEKYLMETRCSGALTRPKSAIAVEMSFQ